MLIWLEFWLQQQVFHKHTTPCVIFQIDKVALTGTANKQHTFVNIFPPGISNRLCCTITGQKNPYRAREHILMHAPCATITNFILDICKPSTWIIQRYKGVWNSLTFVLPFPIHSVLTVLLCSMNMLLSLAFLWTLSPNLCSPVLMNYFILYKADCRAYTCAGASSGLVRLLSHWCQKDTCSPVPCHLFLSAADINLCLCECTNLEPCRNAVRMCDS